MPRETKKYETTFILDGQQASKQTERKPIECRSSNHHLHARASEGAEGGLCAGAGGLRLVSAGGAHLDVQGGDAQLLK